MSEYVDFTGEVGPQIMVQQKVLDKYDIDAPEIDYENLNKLFAQMILAPAEARTIKFYDGSGLGIAPQPFNLWRDGFVIPGSKTIHVPTWEGGNAKSPMQRLAAVAIKIEHNGANRDVLKNLAAYNVKGHEYDVYFPGNGNYPER